MKSQQLYEQGVLPIHLGGSLLCAGLLFGGWTLGLSPLLSDSQQASTVLEQAEQAEAQAKQAKHEVDRLSAELTDVQKRLDDQPVSLQSATQINPLLAELASWSEAHDLSITRTSAGRREALVYYDYVPIAVSGEGGYADLLGFLKKLHEERGDLGVIRFAVMRMPTGDVRFEMDLAWYVLSDDARDRSGTSDRATAAVGVE